MRFTGATWFAVALLLLPLLCAASPGLPADVAESHWAATAVRRATGAGILHPDADHRFHGDRTATRAEAVIALAALARRLDAGSWVVAPSLAASTDGPAVVAGKRWSTMAVSRFTLASVLVRMADYFANGHPRPAAGSTDLGKSVVVPGAPKISATMKGPAGDALRYLASHRLIWPGSPLLTADASPLRGAALSRALHDLTAGLDNRLTELGQNPDGSTKDSSFHKPKPR